MQEHHPDFYEEGFLKNLALGGSILGASMGVGCSDNKDCKTNNNAWQQKKAEVQRDKAELERKTTGLKSGESRTFIQGVPQKAIKKSSNNRTNKEIENSSTTSDAAKDYFK